MEGLPEEKLAQLLGSSLDGEVQRKAAEFGGLLTREAAVRLLCQENGISTEERISLSQARATPLPFSFSARVGRVFPVQHFPGGHTRSVRLRIFDASGEATLVLWNEQASLVEKGGLLAGDWMECSGAYLRAGEIAISRKGAVSRAAKGPSAGLKEGGICNVEGTVEKVEGMREYRDRRTGEARRMLPFTVKSGGASLRAVWWSPPADAPQLQPGAEVALEGAVFRDGELHLNSFSRVVVKEAGGRAGEFRGIALVGGEVALALGEEKFLLSESEALSLFGIRSAPQGVPARTLLSIKASALEGKKVSYSAEGGRLLSLKAEG